MVSVMGPIYASPRSSVEGDCHNSHCQSILDAGNVEWVRNTDFVASNCNVRCWHASRRYLRWRAMPFPACYTVIGALRRRGWTRRRARCSHVGRSQPRSALGWCAIRLSGCTVMLFAQAMDMANVTCLEADTDRSPFLPGALPIKSLV